MNKILYIIFWVITISLYIVCYFKKNTTQNVQTKNINNLKLFKHPLYTKKIPKVIFQTYHKKNKIPQKVYNNIQKNAPGYKHIIFDDSDAITFLKSNFSSNVADKYNNLVGGAHKADLLRYCWLYINGGIYLDIKTYLIKPVASVFTRDDCLYTVLLQSIDDINFQNKIYQGVIATYPGNPIFLKLIEHIINTPIEKPMIDYHIFIRYFYEVIKKDIGRKPSPGFLKGKESNYYLLVEKLFPKQKCDTMNIDVDRYGFCSFVYDFNNIVIKTRYADYPWH